MKKILKYGGAGLLSAVIGFVNGFFGGGGGMLLVPALEKALKCPVKKSHATAIAVILPVSIASAVTYILNGHFQWFPAAFASAGCLGGGVLGALLLKKLKPEVVGLLFACLMIAVGIKLSLSFK